MPPPTADTPAVPPAEQARIISHMNADHQSSLTHYLEYFARLSPSSAAQNPLITSFTTPSMTIEHGPESNRQSWTYKFLPPMLAGQARTRLEAMHSEARSGLGLSEAKVEDFNLDFSTYLSVFLALALQLWVISLPASTVLRFAPWCRVPLTNILVALNIPPSADKIATAAKCVAIGFGVTAHVIEAVTHTRKLLRRFNTTSPVVRALYYIATIIGGFPVWRRLRLVGERLERHLEAKKSKGH